MNIAKYKIFVPETSGSINKKSLMIANVLFLELANYGLELDPQAFYRIAKLSAVKAQKISETILVEYTMGQLNPPLFKNWEERTRFGFGERVVQFFGYVFQFCGNDFDNESFMDEMKRKVDFSKAKKIQLVSNEEFQEYFEKLIGSNLTLDKKTSTKLLDIFNYFENLENLPRIKSAEIRIAALLTLSQVYTLDKLFVHLKCNSLDVLRYAAAKRDFQQFKLPADVKYSNLSWAERIASFKFLNNKATKDIESISEDMGLNRTAWLRYFKHTHFFGQTNFINRFFNLYCAAFISLGSKYDNAKDKKLIKNIDSLINDNTVEITTGGNLVYRTFASRMQVAIDTQNWPAIKKLCSGREGYLMRNISSILNGIKEKYEGDFVKFLKKSIESTDIGILFSLLSIDVNASYRIMDVKGKTVIETAQYSPIFSKVQTAIRSYIKKTYGFSGQVKVSKELENRIVPFLSKNTNLERGSKYNLKDDSFLYFYVHWVQNQNGRTDLDLSFIAFDSNWNMQTVAYYNQANGYMTHSGDLTSAPAPNGATEYGQIRLKCIPKGMRYIAPIINSFSGNNFDQNKEVRAGFYSSDNSKFNLQQESVKYNLTQPAQMNCPFIYDIEKKQIVTLDYNRAERQSYIAAGYADDIKKIISVSQNKGYISIGKLAEMLSGSGKKVELIIKENAKEDNGEISPESLFSLFSIKTNKKELLVSK